MNRVLLASGAALALIASQARAADVSEPPAYDWSGFYLGLGAGYAFDSSKSVGLTFSAKDTGLSLKDADLGSLDIGGIVGGGQAGYNYQIDSVVLGIVGDIQAGSIDDSLSDTISETGDGFGGDFQGSSDVSVFGTLRARMGYAFDRIQFYGTGGLAWGQTDYELSGLLSDDSTFKIKESNTDIGWTVGAGAEYAVTDSVVLGVEYLYVDLGSEKLSAPVNGKTNVDAKTDVDTNFSLIRATLNWKF